MIRLVSMNACTHFARACRRTHWGPRGEPCVVQSPVQRIKLKADDYPLYCSDEPGQRVI